MANIEYEQLDTSLGSDKVFTPYLGGAKQGGESTENCMRECDHDHLSVQKKAQPRDFSFNEYQFRQNIDIQNVQFPTNFEKSDDESESQNIDA